MMTVINGDAGLPRAGMVRSFVESVSIMSVYIDTIHRLDSRV